MVDGVEFMAKWEEVKCNWRNFAQKAQLAS